MGMTLRPRMLILVEQHDWLEGARLPRFFHDAGFDVDLFARRGSIVTCPRHVARCFTVGPGEDYFDRLDALLASLASDWQWILPVTDVDVRGVAARLDRPWARAALPVREDPAVIEALSSKVAMDALLARAGVRVPRSRIVESARDVAEFSAPLSRQVLLKPVDGVGGGGVALLDGARPVALVLDELLARHPAVMAQEFIQGRVGACQAVFRQGVPLAWMTAFKRRTWPGPWGPTSEAHFVKIPGIEPQLEPLGAALGYHGVLSLDLIQEDRTGEVFIIEVNARPAGLMTRARKAGVDMHGAVRELVTGGAPGGHRRGTVGDQVVPLFPQSIVRGLAGPDLASLMSSLSPAALADVPWHDLRLVGSQLRHAIRKVANR